MPQDDRGRAVNHTNEVQDPDEVTLDELTTDQAKALARNLMARQTGTPDG
jgi:hypothetical protein|tara:strand:+ start:2442 stop:2591 length:150 start_codon:yes stop_codon:yes gene_type:complete